ncbi:hypothetical protein AB0D93_40960, partial [Streptomyces sp. NPDC048191]
MRSQGPAGLPFAVAVTPDASHIYVANAGSNNMSVIDAATNSVTATIGVGSFPSGVAIATIPLTS